MRRFASDSVTSRSLLRPLVASVFCSRWRSAAWSRFCGDLGAACVVVNFWRAYRRPTRLAAVDACKQSTPLTATRDAQPSASLWLPQLNTTTLDRLETCDATIDAFWLANSHRALPRESLNASYLACK